MNIFKFSLIIAIFAIVFASPVFATTKPVKKVAGVNSFKKIITTSRGDFKVNIITADLNEPGLELLSLTASQKDCKKNCPAKSLEDYVVDNKALVAIHGAYFCPTDYGACASKKNSYFYPFYNSPTKKLINGSEIKWLQGSILVMAENGNHYIYPSGRDFKSVKDFETKNNTKITFLVSNNPALVQNGKNIISKAGNLDKKQLTTKAPRGGMGFKGNTVYFFVATKATVPDLAAIAVSLGLDTAINLDGGASSAMYYQDKYLVGPGRLLPTAIVVRKK